MPKSLVNRIRLIYLAIDLLFSLLVPFAALNSLDPADSTYALLVLHGLGLGRVLGDTIALGWILGPPIRWIENAPARPGAREVRRIDELLRSAPARFTVVAIVLSIVQLAGAVVILLYVDRYRANIAPSAAVTMGLMCLVMITGWISMAFPTVSHLSRGAARQLFAISRAAGITLQRDRASLRNKLMVLMTAVALTGPLWMSSGGYASSAALGVRETTIDAMRAAGDLARQAGAIDPGDSAALTRLVAQASKDGVQASILNSAGGFVAGQHAMSPPLAAWLASGKDTGASARDATVGARVPATNGLTAIVVSQVGSSASGSTVFTLVAFLVAILIWAPLCAYFLARDLIDPIDEITRTVVQVTQVGKLAEVAAIPVTQNDDLGVLASRFNDLLDTLRDLSSAADALANGDLEIRLAGEGDVATAFRSMVESLGRIVRQIHETSVLLAAAATQIYAASQEQEAAAASQSTAMVEIRQTMESLFGAAAHVSESVRGVLSNAERTLDTTDRMVVRISDLTTHAGRIGEILETIRDISDRSDLLALNGALEASRAGEAGRGFGLVAGEMRRLAERVMSSVHDVRTLVSDIRASGSSTMMATEDSKKLASSTTDAARQITLITQQQRSGTEQVLQSVREIAETLTQSVAAMAQTRASAEQLKGQADKLSSLVQTFRIETPPS